MAIGRALSADESGDALDCRSPVTSRAHEVEVGRIGDDVRPRLGEEVVEEEPRGVRILRLAEMKATREVTSV